MRGSRAENVTFQTSVIQSEQSAHFAFYLLYSMKSAINLNYQLPSLTSLRESSVQPDILKTTIRSLTEAELVRGPMEDVFWIPSAFPFHTPSQFLGLTQPPLRNPLFQLASQKSYIYLPSLTSLASHHQREGAVSWAFGRGVSP